MKEQNVSARMGDILIKEDVINLNQLKTAIREQRETGQRLGETLLNLGYIDEHQLVAYLGKQYGVPAINLEQFEITSEALRSITRESAIKHRLIPVSKNGSTLTVAMSDPSNIFAIDDLKFAQSKCALLDKKGNCSIYDIRPVVCRTYNSTSPPDLCDNDKNGVVTISNIKHPAFTAFFVAFAKLDIEIGNSDALDDPMTIHQALNQVFINKSLNV